MGAFSCAGGHGTGECDDGLEPQGRNRPVACCGLMAQPEAWERCRKATRESVIAHQV